MLSVCGFDEIADKMGTEACFGLEIPVGSSPSLKPLGAAETDTTPATTPKFPPPLALNFELDFPQLSWCLVVFGLFLDVYGLL